jgi:hypothetical protein
MQPIKEREQISPGKAISGWARWAGRALTVGLEQGVGPRLANRLRATGGS